jgi:hypothetical protein
MARNKKTQKSSNQDQKNIAESVYHDVANHIFSFLEEKKYLEDGEHLVAACYSLVTLATNLMAEATDFEDHEILRQLSEIISDSLGYEVEYQIEGEEENDATMQLPSPTKTNKNLLN